MKPILVLITISMIVLSCVDNTTNKDISINNENTSIEKDTHSAIGSTQNDRDTFPIIEEIIRSEFLDLVKIIDSSGYSHDSIKLSRSYSHFRAVKRITENGYSFYEVAPEYTVPFTSKERLLGFAKYREKEEMDSLDMENLKSWKARALLNFKLLEKVKSIYAYHYIAKQPSRSTFIDGLIEQWEFESKEDAKRVAEDLGKKESLVYVNRGAYVCYLENYVYIFHSRSAGFYTPLKNFFKLFVKTNQATKTNKYF